ncbi:unnamed protein product [Schistosoma curassoni]|uniref:Hydrocephalus-inducing protein homolog n=1 Tax=Schistosoma curassoni TaxID=6186 RepID=A0A183JWD3_9TREM|nr:unnamed protein product [Schistosoma curassoni]
MLIPSSFGAHFVLKGEKRHKLVEIVNQDSQKTIFFFIGHSPRLTLPASDSELDTEEEDDSYCKENNHIEKNSENQINEPLEKSHLQMNSCSVSTGTIRKKPKKVISTEAFQASVAEREALAAAANLTLLPDEPPNRLINVVGHALRHGKTVVYEVMRTAARQPDGELIPVGGRQQGVPVILRELVLPGGFDLVSPSFTITIDSLALMLARGGGELFEDISSVCIAPVSSYPNGYYLLQLSEGLLF